jgi:protein-L-isoaspartate(D-aspartate) O-methyltransferase
MAAEIDFLAAYQRSTKRNYLERAAANDKPECAAKAKEWGFDYWDGSRRYGYGGYSYDGRWRPIAEDIARYYGLQAGHRVLDVGCGKGFLLYELTQVIPGLEVAGLDISGYAINNSKPEIRERLSTGNCKALPWPDGAFDLVYSIQTLHNLQIFDLKLAVQEIQRVSRQSKWICVESYRNEQEKCNLLNWQLTCESFFRPEAWVSLYREWAYDGDYGFIYFE